VRDGGLIDSALARPRQRLAYESEADLASLAASYGYGLARNHGYVDGNKRVALMAMFVFLFLNGAELEAEEPEAVAVILRLAEGGLSEKQLADWVRSHLTSA